MASKGPHKDWVFRLKHMSPVTKQVPIIYRILTCANPLGSCNKSQVDVIVSDGTRVREMDVEQDSLFDSY